tara:strand:- start:43 stop:243 length:201 start_codon:yes stop_codon:yes gene_type:complete
MLMVAPTGITKEAIFLLTPRSVVTVFKVTGIVAALDDVEKAKIAVSFIFLKNTKGLKFVKILRKIE